MQISSGQNPVVLKVLYVYALEQDGKPHTEIRSKSQGPIN